MSDPNILHQKAGDTTVGHIVRMAAGRNVHNSIPIRIVENSMQSPELKGEPSHYTTRGGELTSYPSAYSRRGFSNMVYNPSTQHVIVGDRWIDNIVKAGGAVRFDKVPTVVLRNGKYKVIGHNSMYALLCTKEWITNRIYSIDSVEGNMHIIGGFGGNLTACLVL